MNDPASEIGYDPLVRQHIVHGVRAAAAKKILVRIGIVAGLPYCVVFVHAQKTSSPPRP